jgi:gliding motility-associated transport system ATP-binding protein
MVKVEQLVKRYGPALAVNGISFEVDKGEVVGFLGPNGAGKSTTMRILTGFLPATSGKAWIAGHNVFTDSLAARLQVGYMPEGVPIYPDMRVAEFLLYRAAIKQIPSRDRKRRVAGVLDRCHITDVRRKLVGALSKGYRQRVGLADALLADPPVLILDEPTIGLDPKQIRQVRTVIRELGEDHTILLSTHILPEVEMVCSRVLLINEGKVVFEDSLKNINSGNVISITLEMEAPEADAVASLNKVQGVQKVRVESRDSYIRFAIDARSGSDANETIGRMAAKKRWPVRVLRTSRPTLEEVFIRLTAEEAD